MYSSQPWLDEPSAPGPPPAYSAQAQQQKTTAPATSSARAYVLTPTNLPVPAQPQLTPTAIQYHGLPVYGPVLHPAPPNSQNVLSVASLSIGTTTTTSQPQQPQQARKPQVIFHMMNHAEVSSLPTFTIIQTNAKFLKTVSGAENDFFSMENSSNEFSALGTQQIRNFKANFPYMKEVKFVLCSLSVRAANTARQIFGEQLKTVNPGRKVMPLPGLRDCPAKYPSNDTLPLPVFHRKNAHFNDKDFYFFPHDNPHSESSREVQILAIPERADHVRLDLYHFAKVIVDGGNWKGGSFDPYQGTRDIHVVVVSHSNFLTRLTHREPLLSKLYNGMILSALRN